MCVLHAVNLAADYGKMLQVWKFDGGKSGSINLRSRLKVRLRLWGRLRPTSTQATWVKVSFAY